MSYMTRSGRVDLEERLRKLSPGFVKWVQGEPQ